jgi:hypothetical protein
MARGFHPIVLKKRTSVVTETPPEPFADDDYASMYLLKVFTLHN